MTNEEYIQLITDSDVYKNLDPSLQETILKAEGNDKLRYEQIFLTERNGILAAKKDLIERNDRVIRSMELEMKTVKRDFLETSEARDRASEDEEAETLLDSI